MSNARLRRLECRTSLLALAIATAGASVHFAIEVALSQGDVSQGVVIRCPGHELDARPDVREAPAAAARSRGASDPAYLEAVERRCRADGTERCDVHRAIPSSLATMLAQPLIGDDEPHHVFLRYAPLHRRIVWTLTEVRGGLSVDLDAFDGSLVELTDDGVTTN